MTTEIERRKQYPNMCPRCYRDNIIKGPFTYYCNYWDCNWYIEHNIYPTSALDENNRA